MKLNGPPGDSPTYLRSQVQHQVFDHFPKRFGESQQLIEELVTSSEADDVDHPHTLREEEEGNTNETSPLLFSINSFLPNFRLSETFLGGNFLNLLMLFWFSGLCCLIFY